ncbi:hypothetical protein [Lysinibacillus piscis]|uniref:Acyltransferase n=1 Tax=Lysinibacillus piscis TaxID=2518931 RepID=A0ABQ5NPF5_9BACI|nr:hypothetical protein [Lysinibacillus sp. KH24]GLC90003.1 hypothetical protein LYSBPC_31300 [Lysinibacillus sp. KH24]
MEKKRFKFIIPVMVIVFIGSIFMLRNYYEEVPSVNQLLITIGATFVSGILAYFLFPQQGENKIDDRGPR